MLKLGSWLHKLRRYTENFLNLEANDHIEGNDGDDIFDMQSIAKLCRP